jgi:hypothetical protein
MPSVRQFSATVLATLLLSLSTLPLAAQSSEPEALQAVRAAVDSEMQANLTDTSIWTYQDHEIVPGKDAAYITIETRQGTLRHMIELNGQPLSPSEAQAETQRIDDYVHDPAAQARARKDGERDDARATEMLKLLPAAFLWSITSETPELLTLDFKPNPGFEPPDMQARVMGTMSGQMVISRDGNRIRTLHGQLTKNILIGFGILAKLYKGGTFDVERRQVGGGHWQITETHVHISGHALLFKSIGQQEDEVKTCWEPSLDNTLEEAAHTLEAQPSDPLARISHLHTPHGNLRVQ